MRLTYRCTGKSEHQTLISPLLEAHLASSTPSWVFKFFENFFVGYPANGKTNKMTFGPFRSGHLNWFKYWMPQQIRLPQGGAAGLSFTASTEVAPLAYVASLALATFVMSQSAAPWTRYAHPTSRPLPRPHLFGSTISNMQLTRPW